jgi:hypothetical protein
MAATTTSPSIGGRRRRLMAAQKPKPTMTIASTRRRSAFTIFTRLNVDESFKISTHHLHAPVKVLTNVERLGLLSKAEGRAGRAVGGRPQTPAPPACCCRSRRLPWCTSSTRSTRGRWRCRPPSPASCPGCRPRRRAEPSERRRQGLQYREHQKQGMTLGSHAF